MRKNPGASRPWGVSILRAVPSAVVALVITFSADHSTTLGFVGVGAWALATAIVLAYGAMRRLLPRSVFVAHAALLAAGGVVALVFSTQPVAVLLFLVGTLLGVTGALELVGGIVLRRSAEARDRIFVGGVTALTAIAVLLIPADYNQVISIPDKVVPPLTASVIVVGLFGAYCAIVAVYLVIAGLSAKWAPDETAETTEKN